MYTKNPCQSDSELCLDIAFSAGHCHHGTAYTILYWIALSDLKFHAMCQRIFKNQSMSQRQGKESN